MIHNKENEYRKVLEALALRFASGNPVPVERSMITRDEYELLKEAVMGAEGRYEKGWEDARYEFEHYD